MAPKKQKLAPIKEDTRLTTDTVNNKKPNPNRGKVYDEFIDEWANPIDIQFAEAEEIRKLNKRNNLAGDNYGFVVRQETESQSKQIPWLEEIFVTAKDKLSSAFGKNPPKEDDPGINLCKVIFQKGPAGSLPKVTACVGRDEESQLNWQLHERVDRLPTMAISQPGISCAPGTYGRITYGNPETGENPTFTPISNTSVFGQAEGIDYRSAAEAYVRKSSGGAANLDCNIPAPPESSSSTGKNQHAKALKVEKLDLKELEKKIKKEGHKPYSEGALRMFAEASGMKGNELAMFLAQCRVESGNFQSILGQPHPEYAGNEKGREYERYDVEWSKKNNDKFLERNEKRLGNFNAGDGKKYRERGYIQLTGRKNYAIVGNAIGLDLVKNPEFAEDPMNAAKIALGFWITRPKGFREAASNGDIEAVTRIINGKGMLGLKERMEGYIRYCKEDCQLMLPKEKTNTGVAAINRVCNIQK